MPSAKKVLQPARRISTPSAKAFNDYLESVRPQVDKWLDQALPDESIPPVHLHKAMRYSVFAGGKRLRPALVMLSCEAFGGDPRMAKAAACAIEMIHSYSLVHDDLPCMDDADLRRGQPSCHKAFGEATAVLAGDGLLTEAFRVLSETPNTQLVAPLVRILGYGAGSLGMVGGQQADLEAEAQKPNRKIVDQIHLRKTAALISASLEMGAVCARVNERTQRAMKSFGIDVGLAFQIIDDVLDETSDAATLGKRAGQDAEAQKMTYPACIGIEESKQAAQTLMEKARRKITGLKAKRTDRLESLTLFMLERVS